MRTLSSIQKEQLAKHIAEKPIEYIELYNELFDHYSSAYEKDEESFDATLEALDDHFHHQKVKSINHNLLKKTKSSVNEIYWAELKDFWRWPQIISTIGFLIIIIALINFTSIKLLVWYIIIPMLFFNTSLLLYGTYLRKRKKYGNKKFKSAHFNASQHYLNLPTTIFNLCIFLPVMALESDSSRVLFFENYPVVVFILLILFSTSAYIGFKVFRTKIRIQYL
ncbi:MAG: hypothetical protein ACQETL_11050 [Bacteroidota bacterium]